MNVFNVLNICHLPSRGCALSLQYISMYIGTYIALLSRERERAKVALEQTLCGPADYRLCTHMCMCVYKSIYLLPSLYIEAFFGSIPYGVTSIPSIANRRLMWLVVRWAGAECRFQNVEYLPAWYILRMKQRYMTYMCVVVGVP